MEWAHRRNDYDPSRLETDPIRHESCHHCLEMGLFWLEMDHLRLETGLLRHETNSRLMLTYIVVVVVMGQELFISSSDQSSDCLVSV